MALPTGGEWPPKALQPALTQVAADDAWLSGDLTKIRGITNRPNRPKPYQSRAQFSGGAVGAMARGVLGDPQWQGSATVERHLPAPANMVNAIADMMLGKPVQVTLHADDEGQTRLADALEAYVSSDKFAAELKKMGAKWSALGWVYPRLVWDENIAEGVPWVEWVDADRAMPQFAHGRLQSVIFWEEYTHEKHIFRLLSEHTPGQIEYRLFKGHDAQLGVQVPVADLPQTAYLFDVLSEDSTILTGIDDLTAGFIINRDHNPKWRTDPLLRNFGQSDISAAGGLWEDIDKAWTEFWHEVDAGRARMMVSEDLLTNAGPGQGQVFEWFRDVFPTSSGADADAKPVLEQIQFDLRVEAYLQAVQAPMVQAVHAVGLSPITVGMDTQATGQMTATEIRSRSSRSLATFNSRSRHLRDGLSDILTAWCRLYAAIHGLPTITQNVQVALIEPVEDTALDLAQEINALDAAGAISLWWKVRKAHPEWDQTQVDEEVQRIRDDQQIGLPVDPFQIGGDVDPAPQDMTPDEVAKSVTAATALIRAGFEVQDALRAVGLDPVKHTGMIPVTVRDPEATQ